MRQGERESRSEDRFHCCISLTDSGRSLHFSALHAFKRMVFLEQRTFSWKFSLKILVNNAINIAVNETVPFTNMRRLEARFFQEKSVLGIDDRDRF